MSNSNKNKEQDKLFQQSEGQRNSYILRGQDFTVTTASEAAEKSLPGHGQCGESQAEYERLIREASDSANASPITGKGAPRALEVDDAKKPHTP